MGRRYIYILDSEKVNFAAHVARRDQWLLNFRQCNYLLDARLGAWGFRELDHVVMLLLVEPFNELIVPSYSSLEMRSEGSTWILTEPDVPRSSFCETIHQCVG